MSVGSAVVCLPLGLPVSLLTLSTAAFSMMPWIYCYVVQNPEEQHTHQGKCLHYNSKIVCHSPSVCEMTANTKDGCSFLVSN